MNPLTPLYEMSSPLFSGTRKKKQHLPRQVQNNCLALNLGQTRLNLAGRSYNAVFCKNCCVTKLAAFCVFTWSTNECYWCFDTLWSVCRGSMRKNGDRWVRIYIHLSCWHTRVTNRSQISLKTLFSFARVLSSIWWPYRNCQYTCDKVFRLVWEKVGWL